MGRKRIRKDYSRVDAVLAEESSSKKNSSVSPGVFVFIGLLLIALAYALYPFHKESIIPGVLIGIGVVGLTWVVYKIVYTRR